MTSGLEDKYSRFQRYFNIDLKAIETSVFSSGSYSVKDYGVKVDGNTDDSAALNSLISTVSAAGGGIVSIPPGTCLLANPVSGKSNVWIRGSGVGVTIIKGSANFPVPANQANGQGTGLIQYVGAFGSSSTSQPIFQKVAVSDLSFDCTLLDDNYINCMNGIFQDYSQLRHARFERLGYTGVRNGQFILLQGLGRITGGHSYDITCRDIQAVNGAGTVSLYLNAVNDATATYSGITIENIYNYVGNITNIVDDRIVIVAAQVGNSRVAPARIFDISIRNIYIEMDQNQTTTGLVHGVKLDTGQFGYIQNVSVRDIFFYGDGSPAAQSPFIVLISTSGYIQDYLVDGVYGYRCGPVRARLVRYSNSPTVSISNVVLEQSTAPYGIVQLYTASGAQGDELVTFDNINVHATTTTASAILLGGGTTAQGASGAINIRGLVAKNCAVGVSTNKTDTGGTLQAAYNNINISDSNLSSIAIPFSGTGTYTAKNVLGMPDSDLLLGRNWTSTTLTPSATANTPGAAQTCNPSTGRLGFALLTTVSATFAGTFASETAQAVFTATFSDNTTASANAIATATGKQVVASGGLASLTKDGCYVKTVSVAVQSSIASSQVTATANILGIQ